ncbi:T9SS type A sorting domain-containing protein [Aurantibacillus circumpalustris]|uniref:T9SS type A sorting domain-containing protein n=1 Tax=Aurantibacillus circumpalustris TaxID=3036359 RepID=UPI00295AD5FD|nr:T9SS type A sorting domain-containing protein [Aurantibacillus circumpalustris]
MIKLDCKNYFLILAKNSRPPLLDILGCYFEEKIKASSIGVRCINGSVNLKDHCTNTSGNNCVGITTQNQFNGFKYGVFINSWLLNSPSKIIHAKFNQQASPNDGFGNIYISGNYGSQIINCDLKSVKHIGSTTHVSFGLYLDGCDGYVVENNTFYGINASLSGGVFVNNSGPGANSIYNNTFMYHQQCIWAQNINYDNTTTNGTGLVMNCNDFQANCKYNIGVQSAYQGANCLGCPIPYQPGGVSTTQGLANLQEVDNVRNTYGTVNCSDENKFYVSTQNNFSTMHGSFQGAQYHPTPPCSNPLEVTDVSGPPTINQKSVWCTVSQHQNFSMAALNDNASTNRYNISVLKSDFDNKLDGGNTILLLDMFDPSNSATAIFDTLIGKDFLSDTVLLAFFGTSGLSDTQIEDLFSKNGPVSPEVWAYIQTLGFGAPLQSTLEDLQLNQNKFSDRAIILGQLTMAHNELGLLDNEKIRRFLDDTTGIAFDSIAAIYALNELPNSAYKLVDVAIATGNFTIAADLISTLNTDPANEDLCDVFGHILNLQSDQEYIETMRADDDVRLYLKSKAGSDKPLLDTYIKGLLAGVYFEREYEVTLQPVGFDPEEEEEESERRANLQTNELSSTISSINEKIIRVFPNPASEKITVQNDDTLENVFIEIVDLAGKVFIKQRCDKSCEINLSSLNNGVYLLNLYQQDKLLGAKKLVIIK